LLNQLPSLQAFQRSSSRREHRHFNLPLRQLHHLNGLLGGDRCGFEELSCRAAEGCAESDALGDIEPVFASLISACLVVFRLVF
jgi:hypothetical protein